MFMSVGTCHGGMFGRHRTVFRHQLSRVVEVSLCSWVRTRHGACLEDRTVFRHQLSYVVEVSIISAKLHASGWLASLAGPWCLGQFCFHLPSHRRSARVPDADHHIQLALSSGILPVLPPFGLASHSVVQAILELQILPPLSASVLALGN